jgi:hypothetical protein
MLPLEEALKHSFTILSKVGHYKDMQDSELMGFSRTLSIKVFFFNNIRTKLWKHFILWSKV